MTTNEVSELADLVQRVYVDSHRIYGLINSVSAEDLGNAADKEAVRMFARAQERVNRDLEIGAPEIVIDELLAEVLLRIGRDLLVQTARLRARYGSPTDDRTDHEMR